MQPGLFSVEDTDHKNTYIKSAYIKDFYIKDIYIKNNYAKNIYCINIVNGIELATIILIRLIIYYLIRLRYFYFRLLKNNLIF